MVSVSLQLTRGESRRLRAVQAPIIPIVSRWIAETPGTISLGQGIVSYGPPKEAIDALRAFPSGVEDHRYGPVEGEPALVQLIEEKLARENGITVKPASRVVVTAGGNLAFMNAILAVADAGDEILLPVPFYFNHQMAVTIAGCTPVPVRTHDDFQLDIDAIERAITPRTRAIVTVSPGNPTGVVSTEQALRAVNALAAERGLFHIHDEAYEYFTYDGGAPFSPGRIAGAAGHTISLYSLSKAYGMASWRMGYMVVPELLWDAVNKIQDTILICPPAVSQRVAAAALRVGASYAKEHLPALDSMRRRMSAALADAPVDDVRCDGAFYFFLRVRSSMDATDLTERLIREHRVAVIPGSAFGDTSRCSIRVSFGALDESRATEGVDRLVSGLRSVVGA
jgi:aspartate/methionine/tyrosine aminotransferase